MGEWHAADSLNLPRCFDRAIKRTSSSSQGPKDPARSRVTQVLLADRRANLGYRVCPRESRGSQPTIPLKITGGHDHEPTGLSPLNRVILQLGWLTLAGGAVAIGAVLEGAAVPELAGTEKPGRIDKGGMDPSAQR